MSKHKIMTIEFLIDLSASEYQRIIKALDSITNQWIMKEYKDA